MCFDLYKRGTYGETLLHLCFENGSSKVHMELAKRLIAAFPVMINDIYITEDYYGQSCLHMAVVNEDPYMVRYLLQHGANVHQRCVGKFFLPDDQKKMLDSSKAEFPSVSKRTNYKGLCYFGEYPLTFAALLSQQECVRLLLAFGADINKQDSNANTVMHMLVINDNFVRF